LSVRGRSASAARRATTIVNPDDPRFLNPPNMVKAIQDLCKETR